MSGEDQEGERKRSADDVSLLIGGIDLSRLLELARLTDTLLIDADGVYDLADVNDGLLLGLKGTMSELSWTFSPNDAGSQMGCGRTRRATLCRTAGSIATLQLPPAGPWRAGAHAEAWWGVVTSSAACRAASRSGRMR